MRRGLSRLSAALTLIGCAAMAPRAKAVTLARLATSPGDGGVSIELDPYGGFGYRTYGNGAGGQGDAIYDPVGSVGPSSTSWQSAVYFRQPPTSTFLTTGTVGSGSPTGNLPDVGFTYQDGTQAQSAFTHAGLDWRLTQSVEDVFSAGSRVGTLLVQEYVINNPGATTVSFDLVRYYEGDLFLGLGAGVPDGGGRLVVGTEELVFETDKAGEPAATTNLIGITACGGTIPARGRYEVNQWSAFPDRISADQPLGDVVHNDGADPDEFVDLGLDYDVGIALANQFSLAPGQSTVYLTTTVFGTVPPDSVTDGCAARFPPVADAGIDQSVCPGKMVTLDGSGSFDSDSIAGGGTPTYEWDLDVTVDSDGDTIPNDDVDATGMTVTASFPIGTTTVQLTFTDDDGDSATDTTTVTASDLLPPRLACPAQVVATATDFTGGPATVVASANDDCDGNPRITNDRTANGPDASDEYPCGTTLVTYTATDASGNVSTCQTEVRIVPPSSLWLVGAALRVTKLPDQRPHLDWTRMGAVPPEVGFAVLRGTERRAPTTIAPGGDALTAQAWDDPDGTGQLVFYDVRSILCDHSLSSDY